VCIKAFTGPTNAQPPVADFNSNVTVGYAPLSVQFNDRCINADSLSWDFNSDGQPDSSAENPVYVYIAPGTYTVKLTATNAHGTNSKSATITVSEKPASVLPVADFSTNVSEGYTPLSVQFNDRCINADSLSWDFNNDGQVDSSAKNPVHVYTAPGTYTAKLIAANVNGTNSKLATIKVYERSGPVLPVADFKSNVTSGNSPLSVKFTDLSINATGWKWDFGDGASSTEQNPVHTYSATGSYTVTLTVSNEAGTDTETKTGYISVNPVSSKLAANFSASPTSGNAPLKVQFTDKSTGSPTSGTWSFGDGTYSTARNPVHTYSRAGKYTVRLTVRDSRGNSNTKTMNGYITVLNRYYRVS
jgi:PKD repeat protein